MRITGHWSSCWGVVCALLFLLAPPNSYAAVRIKDIARIQGQRQFALLGYGIVTGLAGTGDSAGNRSTRQSLSNLMAQFNLSIPPESITSRNVAVVMISAQMPVFAQAGDALDVTVTSVGDARSLVGGNLLLVPLRDAQGQVHALAQGALTVGGYNYDANGNVIQRNHPTAAVVPGGAVVEVGIDTGKPSAVPSDLQFALRQADYTTAGRVADAINRELGSNLSKPVDAQNIVLRVPLAYQDRLVDLIRRIEGLDVAPDWSARVVVNERTGTVVAGADVRIEPVAISYGELKVSIVSETAVSQPLVVGGYAPGATTMPYTNTRIDVNEPSGATLVTHKGGTVSDLVLALAKIKTSTRDVVSILKALKTAGALHAELLVQ